MRYGKKKEILIEIDPPSEEMLEQYFTLWADGSRLDVIQSELGITSREMDGWLPYFHEFCRIKCRQGEVDYVGKNHLKIDRSLKHKLLNLVGNGFSLPEAAKMIMVPLPTITQQWMEDDKTLKMQLDAIRNEYDNQVLNSVRRSAVGFAKRTREKKEVVNSKGDVVKLVNVKEVFIEPSVSAQKLWLVNRKGWTGEQRTVTLDDKYSGLTDAEIEEALDRKLSDMNKRDKLREIVG